MWVFTTEEKISDWHYGKNGALLCFTLVASLLFLMGEIFQVGITWWKRETWTNYRCSCISDHLSLQKKTHHTLLHHFFKLGPSHFRLLKQKIFINIRMWELYWSCTKWVFFNWRLTNGGTASVSLMAAFIMATTCSLVITSWKTNIQKNKHYRSKHFILLAWITINRINWIT